MPHLHGSSDLFDDAYLRGADVRQIQDLASAAGLAPHPAMQSLMARSSRAIPDEILKSLFMSHRRSSTWKTQKATQPASSGSSSIRIVRLSTAIFTTRPTSRMVRSRVP